MIAPEGYYATVRDEEDYDRYAGDERATEHEDRGKRWGY